MRERGRDKGIVGCLVARGQKGTDNTLAVVSPLTPTYLKVKVFPWRNFGAIIDAQNLSEKPLKCRVVTKYSDLKKKYNLRGDDLSPALLEPVVKILTTVYARLVLKNVSDATSEDCKDSMACAKKVGNCLRRAILWGLVIPKEDTDIEKILVDIALGFKSPLLCAEYVQEV
eukprot:1386460-Amorphochlora_amoeboformis.AAC.1